MDYENESDLNLKIIIIYNDDKQEEIMINKEINLNKIIEIAVEKFKIPTNKKNSLFCYYFDEEEDMNQLEENENIFELANQIKKTNLNALKLYLSHFDVKSSYNLSSSKKISKDIIENIKINKISHFDVMSSLNLSISQKLNKDIIDNITNNKIEVINQNCINNNEKGIKYKNENMKQNDTNKDIIQDINNNNDNKNDVKDENLEIKKYAKNEDEDENKINNNTNNNMDNCKFNNINEIKNNNNKLQNDLLENKKK